MQEADLGTAADQSDVVSSHNEDRFCRTCSLLVVDMNAHIKSIAHMSSELPSDLPHHLDRNSEGFKHMVALGWDPDQRRGLGPAGDGIRFPIKRSTKDDKLGLGARKKVKSGTDATSDTISTSMKYLNPKQMRKLEIVEKAKRKSLHDYLSRG